MPLAYKWRPISIFTIWCYLVASVTYMFLMIPCGLTQHTVDLHAIEPTPALNLQEKELTTVLLVSNDASDSYGRFRSLRPEVGLLTSTARTFIQNGVTTEYATQVVGTTLDNGRVYAQYLKKSSRVLYESETSPTVVTSWVGDSTYLPQSHNDLYNADRPDWQDQDDRLRKVFVGNTDFIGEIYENRLTKSASSLGTSSFEGVTSQSPLPKTFTLHHVSRDGEVEENAKKLAAQKVLPIADLPTYTVKNNFSPSGFLFAQNNKNHNLSTVKKDETGLEGRTPRLHYQEFLGAQVSALRPQNKLSYVAETLQKRKLATTTYYGFADFTTIVGDSVIVFSPSSSSHQINLGQVTSIKGEATLSELSPPHVSYVPITVTEDLIAPTSIHETQTASIQSISIVESVDSSKTYLHPVETVVKEEIFVQNTEVSSEKQSDELQNNVPVTKDTIISSSSVDEIPSVLSRPSDEEVSAIFSLLQKNADSSANIKKDDVGSEQVLSLREMEASKTTIEPSSVATLGGATTIFFEEDPFANFVDATTTAGDELTTQEIEVTNEKATETLPDNKINVLSSLEKPSPSMMEQLVVTSKYSEVSSIVSIQTEKVSPYNPIVTQSGVVIKELPDNEADLLDEAECLRTSQVFLTQLPKIVTYFTTYFTSDTEINSSIETSILNTFDIVETTKKYCIQSTSVSEVLTLMSTAGQPEEMNQNISSKLSSTESTFETQNPLEVENETTTVANSEAEAESELPEISGDGSIDDGEDSEEELELIYKTLYTTYTYLTTIFQESSSSILSHTEVITNIVTSTLGDIEPSSIENFESEIVPTISLKSENKYTVLNNLDSIIREGEDSLEEKDISDSVNTSVMTLTEQLDDFQLNTFHTTYTYFTTIFTEGETEVISRTEVLTNVVTVKPSKSYDHSSLSISDHDDTIQTTSVIQTLPESASAVESSASSALNYSTLVRNGSITSSLPDLENYSSITLITDVRSSSSGGEGHIINDNIMRSSNHSSQEQLIDDQISSESNTEEIIPSATLLLQTSFTTFTYYTTMYNSNSTNVISRLETITNVVTETLNPTAKNSHFEEATLPVTYFTTFTYWTKLAKDGVISTLSREETISNIVTPSSVNVHHTSTPGFTNSLSESSEMSSITNNVLSASENIVADSKLLATTLEPTTYYTTYTYYTTSYEADNTITNSRFETITNVITPTVPLISDTVSTTVGDLSNNSSREMQQILSTKDELLLYDYKKIIDADGISTLFFETRVSPSINENGNPIEITSSTSSLYIDEVKKATSSTPSSSFTTNSEGSTVPVRQYKTGLVRLIEGTRIGNHTTTLYQSRVIGTLIENRYAQIIESTSSFLFEKMSSVFSDIAPSRTDNYMLEATKATTLNALSPTNTVLESSSGDSEDVERESEDDSAKQLQDDEEDDQNNKARLPFQSRKKTFTPVIRPFASRNRPQFAPKKKTGVVSSATIITRSDFTPTITATPALKSTGRFSSLRKNSGGSSINNAFGISSSRRFGRPGKFSTSAVQLQSTGNSFSSSSIRNRFGVSSRGGPALGSSSRRLASSSRSSTLASGSFRPGLSSNFNSNVRFRIKPTAAFGQNNNPTEVFTTAPTDVDDADDEGSTQETNEEESEVTTENSRRNQNPLLRFRRPLTRPNESIPSAINQRGLGSTNNLLSTRRNPLTARSKATSPTTTTTTTPKSRPRGFQRPTIAALPGRQRPQNNLFPPRGLFQIQKQDGTSSTLNKNNEPESGVAENNEGDDDVEYDEDDGEEGEGDNSERKRRSNTKASNKNPTKKLEAILNSPRVQRRSKREAEVSYPPRSNFRNRFRRPKTATSTSAEDHKFDEDVTPESTTQSPAARPGRISSRFGSKHHTSSSSTTVVAVSHRGIRPTRPNTGRAQFTLREKDITSSTKSYQRHNGASFRRPQTTASPRRPSTSISNNRRLKAFSNNNIGTEVSQRSGTTGSRMRSNSLNSGRGRSSTSRGRNRNEFNMDIVANAFDGTITVTHVMPSEVTIPVVNGQITEYKNIITAKTYTEIVGPQQYTSYTGTNGQPTLALTREESTTNAGGATEITQFILYGSPTTTITFTPTTIRGRKTSFSHVLPSTVYSVEKLVSTVQPQLANAPLANILLSQLLLGNIGLPGQAPGNPLLGALNQPLATTPQAQLSPMTEYRTHTSTYVTTIFEGMSTVLPVTFLGKKIVTTVYDTTAQTITATEFITDTIVTTPTQQAAQPAQVNSLLLQQLLLQQQIQPQLTQDFQTHASLKEFLQPESNLPDLDSNNIQDREDETEIPAVEETQLLKSTTRKKQRKSGKSGHRRNKSQGTPSVLESSVITLYVSGRRPGEFSTILSTVQANKQSDSTLQKRQANVNVEKTSVIDDAEDFYSADGSEFVNEYSLPDPFDDQKLLASSQNDNHISLNVLDSSEHSEQTQTLESIVGDVSVWLAKSATLPQEDHVENTSTSYNSLENIIFLE